MVWLLVCCVVLALPEASAADATIKSAIERYVQQQTRTVNGEVSFEIGKIESKVAQRPCADLQAFTPSGSRTLGNTTMEVRCLAPRTWSLYVPVKISVKGSYVVTARALAAGQVIAGSDLNESQGDVGALPPGTLRSADQAIGKVPRSAIAAGQMLRAEQIASPSLIKQNQSVRLTVEGPGFHASSEGKAMSHAAEGQSVQVKTASGSVVTGIVQGDGTVSVPYNK